MVTCNTHRFVARMSHDNALVAEILINYDVVHDCPVPNLVGGRKGFSEEPRNWDIQANGDMIKEIRTIPHITENTTPLTNATEIFVSSGFLASNSSKIDMMITTTSKSVET